ncbi:hypothetical protein ACFQY0_04585 [Haloferula chungangensis]|uniref:Lipoprotein n=1 Tax=Haloferula chungangensis TaxID=1048331 RepID=A0ABW2L4D8_9BACT
MKFAPLFAIAVLTLGSCAPKAIVLSEGFDLNLSNQQSASSEASSENSAEVPAPPQVPANFKPDDGLLDPSGLTAMPQDRDMKPAVEEPTSNAVIAKPPEQAKPTSE